MIKKTQISMSSIFYTKVEEVELHRKSNLIISLHDFVYKFIFFFKKKEAEKQVVFYIIFVFIFYIIQIVYNKTKI